MIGALAGHVGNLARRLGAGADADDLAQLGLVGVWRSGGGASAALCYVSARNAMMDALRIRKRRLAHETLAAGVNIEQRAIDERTLKDPLFTAQVRRIVRARIAAHVAAVPELRPAVECVLYEERPRTVAVRAGVAVETLYEHSRMLRDRLRGDRQLQRLWLDYAEAA